MTAQADADHAWMNSWYWPFTRRAHQSIDDNDWFHTNWIDDRAPYDGGKGFLREGDADNPTHGLHGDLGYGGFHTYLRTENGSVRPVDEQGGDLLLAMDDYAGWTAHSVFSHVDAGSNVAANPIVHDALGESVRAFGDDGSSLSLPFDAPRAEFGEAASASMLGISAGAEGTLPGGAEASLAFISGVARNDTPTGTTYTVARTSYNAWDVNNPATYGLGDANDKSFAFKWGHSQIGASGSTVGYWFDAGSNWTAAEQNAFEAALGLWSALADISFAEAANQAAANIVFVRSTNGTANTGGSVFQATIGSEDLGSPNTQTVAIDTSVAGFGPIGDPSVAQSFRAGGPYMKRSFTRSDTRSGSGTPGRTTTATGWGRPSRASSASTTIGCGRSCPTSTRPTTQRHSSATIRWRGPIGAT